MNYKEKLIAEIQREGLSTQKLLKAVPSDQFNWRPHEKSMNLLQLAQHIAQISHYPQIIATSEFLDFANDTRKIPNINTVEDLVAFSKEGTEKSVVALSNLSETDLEKKWVMKRGDIIIIENTKDFVIRHVGLNHLYHHRGQLGVYLRLLNVPVPGMYGRSADEK
ncbi:MAG: DinB family protein [Brumimicrobium sp.]|nr:DinB family protein [Brumimicrobium sp.]MCO5269157.1 DinB family protein [Brumimicrobium sp.]